MTFCQEAHVPKIGRWLEKFKKSFGPNMTSYFYTLTHKTQKGAYEGPENDSSQSPYLDYRTASLETHTGTNI